MPNHDVAQRMVEGRYRVYKKTREHYRLEQHQAGGWGELETDQQIGKLLLGNCRFIVHEGARVATVEKRFKASSEVPIHSWIECSSYSFESAPFCAQGIVYHNPFTVRSFMDRVSYEAGQPRVLSGADQVRIDGNFLEYAGGRFIEVKPEAALVQESSEAYDVALIYSPLAREVTAIAESMEDDALVYSPLPADYRARRIIGG